MMFREQLNHPAVVAGYDGFLTRESDTIITQIQFIATEKHWAYIERLLQMPISFAASFH